MPVTLKTAGQYDAFPSWKGWGIKQDIMEGTFTSWSGSFRAISAAMQQAAQRKDKLPASHCWICPKHISSRAVTREWRLKWAAAATRTASMLLMCYR